MTDIRVAIVDPSPAFGCGLKVLLEENTSTLNIIGVYTNISDFRLGKIRNVDVIILNLLLIDFHSTVRDYFSDYQTDAILVAIPYGHINAKALVDFDGVLDVFEDGAKMVRRLNEIIEKCSYDDEDKYDDISISAQDTEIIIAVAKGLSNKDIADKLCLSPHTIISHRQKISRKIGYKGIAGFTSYAILNGLIEHSEV